MNIFRKIISIILCVAIIVCVSLIFTGCTDHNIYDGELLRLHIRANSNSQSDQAVKLKVRDAVNAYIKENVDKADFAGAYKDIGDRLGALAFVANRTLRANGFNYGARAYLTNEYFPARAYGDTTIPEGYYDALIIELGAAKGDNWWCVVYPPLCYGNDFRYKSFFAELFK